jgi:hypothetical protein
MKNIIKIFSLFALLGLLVTSCSKDEVDVEGLTDFAPGIVSISPSNNSKIVVGNFDIKVIVADGESSPLAEISLTLSDDMDNEIISETQALSGTRDSLVLEGSSFNAELLGAGSYAMQITVTDTDGQSTNRSTTFEISLLPFAANHDEMYIAGAFNGWGADEMELVADHVWEIRGVDLQGEPWKVKNCFDWCDEDWGDGQCDGIMESNLSPDGNANTDCGFSGEVVVRFNDETLEYEVRPLVTFETNLSGLYLLGSFNNFNGDEYPFSLVDDNTWVLEEARFEGGEKFKFAEMPNFMGKNYGDGDGDGVMEEFGENTMFMGDPGFYRITFNEKTLEYSMEFLRGLVPAELYLVGALDVHGAWGPDGAIPFNKVSDNAFEIFSPLEAGQGFKFLPTNSGFDGDWGIDPENPGFIIQEGEENATVEESGFYLIRIDFADKSITYTKTEWGVIGDGTPTGWDGDTDMTQTGDFEFSVTLDLTANFIKFRANDMWNIDFGDNGADGTLERGGENIAVPEAGNYDITMRLHPVDGYTYSLELN